MPMTSNTQHILVVEDNDDDFECTLDAFYENGNFRNPIVRVKDGQEALAYLRHQAPYNDAHDRPGLVLLDLNLPGLDGKSVLQNLRMDKELKSLPVIIFTTSDDPMDINRCYELGANSYVAKPTTLEGLVRAIQMLRDYWFQISILPKT